MSETRQLKRLLFSIEAGPEGAAALIPQLLDAAGDGVARALMALWPAAAVTLRESAPGSGFYTLGAGDRLEDLRARQAVSDYWLSVRVEPARQPLRDIGSVVEIADALGVEIAEAAAFAQGAISSCYRPASDDHSKGRGTVALQQEPGTVVAMDLQSLRIQAALLEVMERRRRRRGEPPLFPPAPSRPAEQVHSSARQKEIANDNRVKVIPLPCKPR